LKLNRLQTSLPKSRKIKTHPVPSRVQQFSILQTSVNFLPSVTFVTIAEASCFKNSYLSQWELNSYSLTVCNTSGTNNNNKRDTLQKFWSHYIERNSEKNRWPPNVWSEKLKNYIKILLKFLKETGDRRIMQKCE
jgi:hypothetical protein